MSSKPFFMEDAVLRLRESRAHRIADKMVEATQEVKAALHGTLGIDASDPAFYALGHYASYEGMEFHLDKRDSQTFLTVHRPCAYCDRKMERRFVAMDEHSMTWLPLTAKIAEWLVENPWCRSCSERMALPRWSRPLFYLGKWYEKLRHRVSLAWQAGRRAANGN